MSFVDGWAAINLEMPARVPHTEYSLENHWALIRAVTGLEVDWNSPPEARATAGSTLTRAWNFDLVWSTLISDEQFGTIKTDMGHAEYLGDASDFRAVGTYGVCPFNSPEEVLAFDPFEVYGRIDQSAFTQRFSQHYRDNCTANPDTVNMTGIYITLISGLIAIFGWEMLLLAAGTDATGFGAVTERYAAWMQQYYNALAETDIPVVMVHDDIVWSSGAFISPAWYRKYVFPNYRKYFAPLIDSGKKILFTSDGNYTRFIDDIAACGVNGFVLEPNTDMAYIAEKYGRTHAFIGNADTRIVLSGTRAEIRVEVERCMAIGKGCPGFFMAVGNHIPNNTPVENVRYYEEVYEELSKR
jgi:hypothetical protein